MTEQRYRVIERIESGGMAEVFKGEALSVQGFKKKVAIKRVLPHLAQNQNFMAMFLDEARLGARMNHANIVTVFDIGAADNTFFIVMEFIDGMNLKSIMEGMRKQGRRFPVKEAVYICIEACRGLSYAHETPDDQGNPLNIVHRDVSPPNILVSKRGEVKLTDFGLAKATTQLEKTDPGVVKGKFSYLSPEAAVGQPVDARADLFALGIVLWEMLAGRRLFLGDTDYQTVKLVQQANIPSLRSINPDVDQEFEQLLGKVLSQDPDQRFQSARDFGDALTGYIFKNQMKVTAYDIAAMVKSIGSTAPKKTPSIGPKDQSIIDRLIQEELLSFTSIDDMEDPFAPGSDPLLEPDVAGAAPLDALSFENPADWFSNDAEVANAFDQHKATANTAEPGWRESGLAEVPGGGLANLLEGAGADFDDFSDPRMSPPPGIPQPQGPGSVSSIPAPMPSNAPRPKTHKAVEAKKSNGLLVAFILVLILAGAAAAAWFSGVIPPELLGQ